MLQYELFYHNVLRKNSSEFEPKIKAQNEKFEETKNKKKLYVELKQTYENKYNLFYCCDMNSVCFEKDGKLQIKNITDAKTYFCKYDLEKKNFIDLWNRDLTRKELNFIEFDTTNKIQNIYNTFKGFKYNNNEQHCDNVIEPRITMIKKINIL